MNKQHGLSCAVITPVGPGHAATYEGYCAHSIEHAAAFSSGAFTAIERIAIDDSHGALGRSRARNMGVQEAIRKGCDWVFFLDADDFLFESAFEDVAPYLQDSEGVWGMICEAFAQDLGVARVRPRQVCPMDSFQQLLDHDPFLTLQMGHFVRTAVAADHPFDESLDVGEDFRYYCDVWRQHRCKKIAKSFFLNVRGNHSTGPRSGVGGMWRKAVEREIRGQKNLLHP